MKVTPKDCTLHTPQGVFGPGTVADIPDEVEARGLISRGFADPAPSEPKPGPQGSTGPNRSGGKQGRQT